jgi:methionine-rich copper-binding protein CopC
MRRLLSILAVCAATVFMPAPAQAHTSLRHAVPGPGDKLRPGVSVLALSFDGLKPGTIPKVGLLGPSNAPVPTGGAVVAGNGTVCAAATPLLGEGEYTLVYSLTAADGDWEINRFYFAVTRGGAPAATPPACKKRDLPDLPGRATVLGLDVPAWTVPAGGGGLAVASVAAVIAVVAVRRRRIAARPSNGRSDGPSGSS